MIRMFTRSEYAALPQQERVALRRQLKMLIRGETGEFVFYSEEDESTIRNELVAKRNPALDQIERDAENARKAREQARRNTLRPLSLRRGLSAKETKDILKLLVTEALNEDLGAFAGRTAQPERRDGGPV